MIAGPPSGSAVYVTIEGRDITQHKLIRTSGSTSTFEFPVDARYEPGATISVISIKDGSQWNGTRYIRIPPVSHELKIKMATDKPQYLPGDSANYSMDVTDNTGKPVRARN